MGWPRNDKPPHKLHWPYTRDKSMPACGQRAGVYKRPEMAKGKGDITCEKCKTYARM